MNDWTDRERLLLRAGLAGLALGSAVVGVWGTLAPRSFYNDFPGGGRHWVSPLGPYDEHLVRDFAAANLGFLALAIFAAVVLDRRLVQGALLAFAVAALPHLAFHATETGPLSTGDNVGTLAALALTLIVPVALLAMTARRRSPVAAS